MTCFGCGKPIRKDEPRVTLSWTLPAARRTTQARVAHTYCIQVRQPDDAPEIAVVPIDEAPGVLTELYGR